MLALIKSVCAKTGGHSRAYGSNFYDRVYYLGLGFFLCGVIPILCNLSSRCNSLSAPDTTARSETKPGRHVTFV